MARSFREPPARRCGWRPSPGPYRSHPLPDGARGGERPGSKLIPAHHRHPYPSPIRAPKRDHDEWLVRGGWAGRGSLRSGQSRGRSYSQGQKPCGSAVNDAGGACPLRPKCLAAAWRRQGQEPLNPLWYKPKTPAAGRGSGPTFYCGLPAPGPELRRAATRHMQCKRHPGRAGGVRLSGDVSGSSRGKGKTAKVAWRGQANEANPPTRRRECPGTSIPAIHGRTASSCSRWRRL